MDGFTLLLMAALAVGFLVGILISRWRGARASDLERAVQRITMLAVLLLLYSLGFELGRDDGVHASLSELGWTSLLLAVGAMTGSVFMARILAGPEAPRA